ncbi:hypothetical protein [Sulfurimonas sp. NWX79]|uniref:Cthe_2314 family HEPN domain-containing protein n=1 Tax=Sulfurimonas sp. NWX79 TaxID=2925412 RepID=UPI003204EA9A
MIQIKLKTYFIEANKHIALIIESLDVLTPLLPVKDYAELNQLQRFALNALIFRFSKLQDLLGAKVFRTYLEYNGFNTQGISYFEILREIEKEGIVDIDTWGELRELRNKIAHDYPEELDEMVESINLFINRSSILVDIAQKMERSFYEIERKRD